MPNFIALGIYFLFGAKFSWNEEIDTCFNVICVLLGRNFDFLGGYLVVPARYLMVTASYYSLPSGYCSLLVVTARYRSLLLVRTFNMIISSCKSLSSSSKAEILSKSSKNTNETSSCVQPKAMFTKYMQQGL